MTRRDPVSASIAAAPNGISDGWSYPLRLCGSSGREIKVEFGSCRGAEKSVSAVQRFEATLNGEI